MPSAVRWIRSFLLGGILIGCGRAESAAPAPEVAFRVGDAGEQIRIWGGGFGSRPACFPELLPGLFERTLQFDRLAPQGGALLWIFTGPHGGLTVRIEDRQIVVLQRYYDSDGLTASDPVAAPAAPLGRYPEKVWQRRATPLSRPLTSLTVSLDQHMNCVVRSGAETLLTVPCLLELHEHQLKWEGTQGGASGRLEVPAAEAATVSLRPDVSHQSLIGFGGITSPLSYRRMSPDGQRRWWELLAAYNLRIQREYPTGRQLKPDFSNFDHPGDAVPHYYGDNPNDAETSDFRYNRAVQALGGETWFEFWELPRWMVRQPDAHHGAGLADERPDPKLYARAIVAYCRESRRKSGAPPAIVGVQNETCQSPESLAEMVPELRRELDRAGFSAVKIAMANAPSLKAGVGFAARHRATPAVWAAIDYAASNVYDTQNNYRDADADRPLFRAFRAATGGKDFLSTEICVSNNRYQTDSYGVAFALGQVFYQNLTEADARALLYCWLLVDVPEPSFGWTRMLFRIDQEHGGLPVASADTLRVLGAFSRHLPRGMVRVDAASSDPDLLATAFEGEGGAETVILINRGTRSRRVTLAGARSSLPSRELADPYHENAPLPAAAATSAIEIPAGALVTLSSVPTGALPPGFSLP